MNISAFGGLGHSQRAYLDHLTDVRHLILDRKFKILGQKFGFSLRISKFGFWYCIHIIWCTYNMHLGYVKRGHLDPKLLQTICYYGQNLD